MDNRQETPLANAVRPGVMDLAKDKNKIQAFLRHQAETGKMQHKPEEYAEMEAYLSSEEYGVGPGPSEKRRLFLLRAFSLPDHQKRFREKAGCLRVQRA